MTSNEEMDKELAKKSLCGGNTTGKVFNLTISTAPVQHLNVISFCVKIVGLKKFDGNNSFIMNAWVIIVGPRNFEYPTSCVHLRFTILLLSKISRV